jgi:hypothetical protein
MERYFLDRAIIEVAVIARIVFIIMLALALLSAQQPPAQTTPKITDAIVQKGAVENNDDEPEYMCPMDKDIRSKTPGKCIKCGMTLVLNLPEAQEYPVRLTMKPRVPKVGEPNELHFRVDDPAGKQVKEYEVMHEKLYHLFVVSQDTTVFNHVHPEIQPDGSFILNQNFPKPGLYRVLSDFYPKGGTPQLISTTVMVPGEGFKIELPKLKADVSPQDDKNLHVELVTDPPEPLAGFKAMMFFRLTPNEDIEQYLGAWGHMLAASSDLIDMMHTHPFDVRDPEEAKYKQIQFNLIFPREGIYRVWVQFQRKGVVNTVAFNVPVTALK